MSQDASIIIVGAGPVGLLLAHILGKAGVAVTILELAEALPDEPRAVGLDPETLRTLQNLDLLDLLAPDLMYGVTGDYVNANGDFLFKIGSAAPTPLGYPNLVSFNQPGLVKTLAASLTRYPSVTLLYGHKLVDFDQSEGGVRVCARKSTGQEISLAADYLVGCDGGRSTIRAKLGIAMQGESNPQPWLVIDTIEEPYDGQRRFRFFCDPARPGMFLQTPHNNRRWEWMLLPGEDRETFLQDDTIHAILEPFVDVSKVHIYRRRVYDFHSIIADSFQRGRVFLAGDAAHMTPPFAGQGLNSGIRDVTNLGWKLAAVIGGAATPSLLDSYEPERWTHAKQLIDTADMLGRQIQPLDPDAAAQRDAMFFALQSQPNELMAFEANLMNALLERSFSEGFAVDIGKDHMAGRMISQPRVTDTSGKTALLDERLGDGFAIVGYNCDPSDELEEELVTTWLERGVTLLPLDDTGCGKGLALETDSHLADMFAQSDCNMILLRPDRFCMAAFRSDNAADILAQAAAMLDGKE